jgi:D-3-phosphoglycerate dehydrogenase / 2-oxoglutarate reductase
MRIAILDDYQDAVRKLDCFNILSPYDVKIFNNPCRAVGQLAIRLASFDAIVLIRERTPVTRALLSRLPNLKLISQTGRMASHIDLEACTERGVAVAEGIGSPVAPAELTWALIMASARKLVPYANNLKDGLWQTASINPVLNGLGFALRGRRLGIWGYGKIGKLVAGYGQAFGMDVLVWGSEASRARAAADGYRSVASKEALFEQADVLSLHLRLSERTRGIVTAADLALMKPTALLVNTSRAELVEEGALEAALHKGRPGQAALDVFTGEPLPADAPLLRIPTVLATPHLGYVEQDSYEIYFRAAFENLVRFAEGRPDNLVNPEVLAGPPFP